MTKEHDVQAMSGADLRVYEAVAARATSGDSTDLATLLRQTALPEDQVRQSLARLVEFGAILPDGDGYRLGEHTFEVEY